MNTRKILCCLYMCLLCSCKHFLDEEVVSDVSYGHYNTLAGVESGVAAAYSPLRYQYENELCPSLQELGTDTYQDGADAEFRTQLNRYEATLNPDLAGIYNYWSNYYKGINTINTVLGAMEQLPAGMTEDLRTARTAELRFLRGMYYFWLVQTFGKVPLVTTPELAIRTDFKRAPISQVYEQIIADLRFAIDVLPPTQRDYGRATKGAAQHALALVYLTRGSAVKDQRGQKPTDMDSAAWYADQVIFSNIYQLAPDFNDLWDIKNQKNSEVIFAVQFSVTQLYNNNSGNRVHLYYGMAYDIKPGMKRDVENGRPWKRIRPTNYTILELFDRKHDARFYKTFKSVWLCNNEANIPRWTATAGFTPPAGLLGKPKFRLGDTAIWVTAERLPPGINKDSLYASKPYYYIPMDRQSNADFFVNRKFLDPTRPGFNDEIGFRDGILFRLGETYLIAAEAYGRKGNYALALERLNVIRKRAAYKQGEAKPPEYWKVEGGKYEDRLAGTEPQMLLTEADIAHPQGSTFVDFMLDERGREMNGELRRWWDLVRTEKLVERVKRHNPGAANNVREYHRYRPIPQNHIDRLDPPGAIEEEQNEGYY